MKITKTLLLGAVAAAAFTTALNLQAANFSPSDLNNRAIAASPRALEQFPWLARGYNYDPAKQSFEVAPLK